LSVPARIGIVFLLLLSSCLELDDDVVTELKKDNVEEEEKEPEWFYLKKKDGLAEDTVTTMLKDSRGDYWFGHFRKGITKWDGDKTFTRISTSNGLSNNYVFRIVEAPDGKIWVATSKGYDIISSNSTVEVSQFYNYAFSDIAFPKPGVTWLSSQIGIHVVFEGGSYIMSNEGCQPCNVTQKLLVDSDNNVWASSLQDIRRYNASGEYGIDKQFFLSPTGGFPYVIITEIFEDNNKIIYGGSIYGQFNTFKLTGEAPFFFNFSTVSGTSVSAITTYNNLLWVGTRGSGIIRTNGQTNSQIFNELPSAFVFDLMNDGNSIWIATLKGVAKHTAR
jgi:ligand-binding sensor domain-containing protein